MRNKAIWVMVFFYFFFPGTTFTCFDASAYGVLILADLEEEYFPEEIQKLNNDILKNKLSIIVLAEWYYRRSLISHFP